ncbi:glycosyltransferase family 4 protein [Priestia flexa]|uniref:glycosyltransferase family 4 protein n=1 Tax=Priestia flexa TaxID=86664 RepID=UPI001CFD261A|nr:glycosyltransferase family 4 protein [Priestia flexa]
MKKILIINSFYKPNIKGGAEVSSALLCESLNKDSNIEVFVLTTTKEKKIVKEVVDGVQVIRIPHYNIYWLGEAHKYNYFQKILWHCIHLFNPKMKKELNSLLNEIQPTVVHSQNLLGIGTFIWGIANRKGIRVVHTIRDFNLLTPTPIALFNLFVKFINKLRSKSVHDVVGVSNYVLDKHLNNKIFRYAKKHTIHNVVDSVSYRDENNVNNESLRLGYYGQLTHEKGVDIIINAVRKLSSEVVKELIIIGEGSKEKELKKLAQSDKRIKFFGKKSLSDVYNCMANTDLTILPSRWEEPFGRVIIESYAQGTSVIASRVGGIPDVIVSKEFLFERDSVMDLTNKIMWFREISKNNKEKRIKENLEYAMIFKENIDKYKDVYFENTGE